MTQSGDLVAYLNFLLSHDRNAISRLFNSSVPCGKALATNPMIEVKSVVDSSGLGSPYIVDIVDILNGFLKYASLSGIDVEIDPDTGEIKKFYEVRRG